MTINIHHRSFVLSILVLAACAQPEQPSTDSEFSSELTTVTPPPFGPSGNWLLAFSDEFNGTRLDTKKWTTNYPYGRTPQHGELEGYASSAVTVANGMLNLTATRKPLGSQPYTSGMVTSAKSYKWLYGVAEIRLKTPPGVGYWPAFWTMNIPYGSFPPEIDMLELKGGSPSTIWLGHYWGLWPVVNGWQKSWTGANFTTGFHTVTVVWKPGSLTWYVDGIWRAGTTSHIPQTGMYLIANLAVGGTFAGNPTSATVFPGTMRVDYIRVWK
ncbi:MAG: glycoside hydrolase family 16 protein [Gemmatimonadota bacterium]